MTSRAKRRQSSPSRSHRTAPAAPPVPWLAVAALLVAGVATYWNALRNPFVWDDDPAIVTNQTIRQVWPLSVPLAPPLETAMSGRPVANLSLAMNYAMSGTDVGSYHAFNLVIHLACGLLLFGLVRLTLARVPSARSWPIDATAATAAALWLVHPLQSEVIDYVTQRTESLMAMFFLLTLYAAVRARRSSRPERWHVVAVACGLLGVATKESMATAPLVVLLYDRVFEFESFTAAWRERKTLYMGLAASWAELALVMWRWPRSTVGVDAVTPFTYLLNQTEVVPRYLQLVFWPNGLVLDYGLPRAVTLSDAWPGLLLLLALVAATIVALVRWPRAGFLAAVFFITLAPTSSVVPIASEVGAERRMYLPLAALAVLAVVGVQRLLDRWPDRVRVLRRAAAALAIVLTAALAFRTVRRNAEFADPLTLWETVVERRPHGRARMAYGAELMTANRHEEALVQLRQAVTDFPNARAALGTELLVTGQAEEAARVFRAFIADAPSLPNRIPAHLFLARALMMQGLLDEAAAELRVAVQLVPDDQIARQSFAELAIEYRKRAEAALKQGDVDRAMAAARQALTIDQRDSEAHNLLGAALATAGRMAEAIGEFQQAVAINPNDQRARNNLAHALAITRGR